LRAALGNAAAELNGRAEIKAPRAVPGLCKGVVSTNGPFFDSGSVPTGCNVVDPTIKAHDTTPAQKNTKRMCNSSTRVFEVER
jgi:hypothetical protein